MLEVNTPGLETTLTTSSKPETRVERLSGFEAWEQEKQTDRYQEFYNSARQLKNKLRQSHETVYQETKDTHSLPSNTYAAAMEIAYALVQLLEQAPSIAEGIGDADYPDYPHQEGFIEFLQAAIEELDLPYEIHRKTRGNEIIELKAGSEQDRTSLIGTSRLPDASNQP